MNWASPNPKSLLFKTSMNALSFPAKLLTISKSERPKEFQINRFSSKKLSLLRMKKKERKLGNLILPVSRLTVSSSKWLNSKKSTFNSRKWLRSQVTAPELFGNRYLRKILMSRKCSG
jgi:hypothetical protein